MGRDAIFSCDGGGGGGGCKRPSHSTFGQSIRQPVGSPDRPTDRRPTSAPIRPDPTQTRAQNVFISPLGGGAGERGTLPAIEGERAEAGGGRERDERSTQTDK